MNRVNGKPLGDIVPPRGGSGKAAPEKNECNIGMTFEQLEKTWGKCQDKENDDIY